MADGIAAQVARYKAVFLLIESHVPTASQSACKVCRVTDGSSLCRIAGRADAAEAWAEGSRGDPLSSHSAAERSYVSILHSNPPQWSPRVSANLRPVCMLTISRWTLQLEHRCDTLQFALATTSFIFGRTARTQMGLSVSKASMQTGKSSGARSVPQIAHMCKGTGLCWPCRWRQL